MLFVGQRVLTDGMSERWTPPGKEALKVDWMSSLKGWTVMGCASTNAGTFGKIYPCRSKTDSGATAVCKYIPIGDKTTAKQAQHEINAQIECARFAPLVMEHGVNAEFAYIVMERSRMCVTDLMKEVFKTKHNFNAVMHHMSILYVRLMLLIGGFVRPSPGIDFCHGDLTINNVLVDYPDHCTLDNALHTLTAKACDFGHATLYASGVAIEPLVAAPRKRRPARYDETYDISLFTCSFVGFIASSYKVPAKRVCDKLIEYAPKQRSRLRPSIRAVLDDTAERVRLIGAHEEWQYHEIWKTAEILENGGITRTQSAVK